jgi:phage shock protein A
MRLVARAVNLLRGALAQWLGRREGRSPGAVYEAAIQERIEQYGRLRSAAAGVLYMRGKLAGELERHTAELARLGRELDAAVDRDEDAIALLLIPRRDALAAEVERVAAELAELTTEAEAAKRNLVAFRDEIARLRDERVRMLARLANASARLKLQETLTGLSPDADIQALDAVREHIERVVAEARLTREVGDEDLTRRLGYIRDAEITAGARAQLAEMKRARGRALLPVPAVG